MKRSCLFKVLYFTISAVEIWAAVNDTRWLVYIFKPMLMPVLLLWSAMTPDVRAVRGKRWLQAGLVFACLGDVFLMFPGYFLPGLGAFLVMQVLYILAFGADLRGTVLLKRVAGWGAILLLFLAGILALVLPRLGDPLLRVSVTIYAVTISGMVLMALLREEWVSRRSGRWVLAGALLFLVSDSLIAVNRFVEPVPHHHFWIMTTYVVAQFGIVGGMLKAE